VYIGANATSLHPQGSMQASTRGQGGPKSGTGGELEPLIARRQTAATETEPSVDPAGQKIHEKETKK